jgi:hypothetical protein
MAPVQHEPCQIPHLPNSLILLGFIGTACRKWRSKCPHANSAGPPAITNPGSQDVGSCRFRLAGCDEVAASIASFRHGGKRKLSLDVMKVTSTGESRRSGHHYFL